MRFCRSASAALPPEHHRAFEDRFGIGVIETMGMTETAAPAFSNPLNPEHRRIGSIGRPSGTRARACSGAMARRLPTGRSARSCCRARTSWRATPATTRGHARRLHARRLAAHGRPRLPRRGRLLLHHRARLRDADHQGGENIAPREIGEAAAAAPRRAGSGRGRRTGPGLWAGRSSPSSSCAMPRPATTRAAARALPARTGPLQGCRKSSRFITELPRRPSGEECKRLKLLDPA
ncbi:AMP-binding protein [Cupriavidus basilensis]